MNPEKATDYLSRVNWKSLVEWLTAEAILNRPANPIQFCRDLLGEKLADQQSADFKPDGITEWLRSCYTEATALVDEHGIIQGKTLEAAQQSLPEQVTELRRKVEGMQQLLDASSTIATLDPHQATDNIVAETCRILNCDRATIFTVDNITKELVLSVAEGAKNIRVPIGQGIAGTVAATGETINIVDAYADSRFSSRCDRFSYPFLFVFYSHLIHLQCGQSIRIPNRQYSLYANQVCRWKHRRCSAGYQQEGRLIHAYRRGRHESAGHPGGHRTAECKSIPQFRKRARQVPLAAGHHPRHARRNGRELADFHHHTAHHPGGRRRPLHSVPRGQCAQRTLRHAGRGALSCQYRFACTLFSFVLFPKVVLFYC